MHLKALAASVAAVALAAASVLTSPAVASSVPTSDDARTSPLAGSAASPTTLAELTDRLAGRQTGPRIPRVHLVVRTTSSASAASVRRAARSLGLAATTSDVEKLGYVTVESTAAHADAVRQRLTTLAGVVSVSEAQRYDPMWTPTDPKYSLQSGMYDALQGPAAWADARGNGATIAILDGGFQASHPDLAGKVVGTWDVVARNTDVSDVAASLAPGHGTAVASVAAAATTDVPGAGVGIAGAAPEAKLLLVSVGDALGDIYDSASAAGIVWATDHGADVISMSYGAKTTLPSAAEQRATQYAADRGVILVASAGNTPTTATIYPAAHADVISVGATNLAGTAQTSWSAYGLNVAVGAPGEDVPVAFPLALDTFDGVKDGYTRLDGTSFSAPIVAGEAALLRAAHPHATWLALKNAIEGTTRPITAPAHGGFRDLHGVVQFRAALDAVPADTVITGTQPSGPGLFEVDAASSSQYVRFELGGMDPVTIFVVGGVARVNITTWGEAGITEVVAKGCDAGRCAPEGDRTQVTISNPAPVIAYPVDGSLLGDETFPLGVVDQPGPTAIRYVADVGTPQEHVLERYFADPGEMSDGVHEITAFYCDGYGRICDLDHPSAPVTVTVSRPRATLAISSSLPFSPNGDGRRDTASFPWSIAQASTASIGIKNGDVWIAGPFDISTAGPAQGVWTWDGRNNDGVRLGGGYYTAWIELSATIGTPSRVATARRQVPVEIDTTPVNYGRLYATPSTVFPVVDGYGDSVLLAANADDPIATWTATVYASTGAKVRTITGGFTTSRMLATFNGRTASGALLPAGRYSYAIAMYDMAGNRTLTPKSPVTVSWKKLRLKTASKKISAKSAASAYYYDGVCNAVYGSARPGVWPTSSLAFVSRKKSTCSSSPPYNYAMTKNRFTLPTAIRYGTVKVAAYGGGSPYGTGHKDDVAELDYLKRDGDTPGKSFVLSAPTTTHPGPAVRAAEYLVGGRTIMWMAGTSKGNWWDVRDYTITWTYYALG